MREYVLKDKTILATEKAYKVLYQSQGYLPKEAVKEKKSDKNKPKEAE